MEAECIPVASVDENGPCRFCRRKWDRQKHGRKFDMRMKVPHESPFRSLKLRILCFQKLFDTSFFAFKFIFH